MTDPLSIAAGIIAVQQCSQQVIKFLKDVKEAEAIKSKLLLEVLSTHDCLEKLKASIDSETEGGPIHENTKVLERPIESALIALQKLEKGLAAQSGLKKLAKALQWPTEKADVKEAFNALERCKTLAILALQLGHVDLNRALTQQLSVLRERARDQEFRDIIRWLSPLDYFRKQDEAFSKHEKGTGQWLLDDAKFKEWKTAGTQHRLLWGYGVPGAGKTVLASTVIDHLTETFKDENIAVLGTYCDYKEMSQQTMTRFLASLLGQLMYRQSIRPEEVKTAFDKYSFTGVGPSSDRYLEMVVAQVATFDRVFIIVDALDECTEVDNIREDLLHHIMKDLTREVSVLITSRHISGIEPYSDDALTMTIEAQEDDVRRHVRSQLQKRKTRVEKLRLSEKLQAEIVDVVAEKAEGM